MKTQEEYKKYIIDAFSKMESKEDFLSLLNYAKKLVYGEKAFPFELRQINYYINSKSNKKRYTQFTIKKKSGQERIINAPTKGLKSIQKCINLILQVVYEKHQHKAANGFVPEKSIVDNARVHIGSIYVYNIDLKDFFPSIDQPRVWKRLQMPPFNLKKPLESALQLPLTKYSKDEVLEFINKSNSKESYKKEDIKRIAESTTQDGFNKVVQRLKEYQIIPYEEQDWEIFLSGNLNGLIENFKKRNRFLINNMISALCCAEMEVERLNENNEWVKIKKNVLPQGAPTSPTLTNIICQQLDFYLSAVAKRFGLKYSRYADDITFSSMHNVFQKESDFIKELHRIVAVQNFTIKESKTRLQKQGYKQEVTGLIVNEKVNVQQHYIKQLRLYLYRWEKLGYEKANEMFLFKYHEDKGHTKKGNPNMTNVIAGKLYYLQMVKGSENNMYKKLKDRFDILAGVQNKAINKKTHLERVLEIIIKEGLDKAMTFYKAEYNESKQRESN